MSRAPVPSLERGRPAFRWAAIVLCAWLATPSCGTGPLPNDSDGSGGKDGLESRPTRDARGEDITPTSVGMTQEEEVFLMNLMARSQLAIDMVWLARDQDASAPVKELAAQVAERHRRVVDRMPLPSVGATTSWRALAELEPVREHLRQMSGREFDAASVDALIEQDQELLQRFEQLGPPSSEELKRFLDEARREIAAALDAAQQVKRTLPAS